MLMKAMIAALCVMGVATLAEQTSPVFLWAANSPVKPALQTVGQDEFASFMTPLLTDHMVVAFQEENLSTKDFLCANTQTSQSCYAHLQGVSQKTYYASVQNPADALRSVAAEREFNNVGVSGKLATPIECTPGKVVFVNFDSAEGERAASLESHDAAIAAITNELSCPVVYLYMSAPSNAPVVKSRLRRSTAATTGGYLFRQSSQFLIFFTKVNLMNNGVADEIIISSMRVTNNTNTATATLSNFTVALVATNGKELTFDIGLSGGYFTMNQVAYDGQFFRSGLVSAPTTFSYYCGNVTLPGTTSSEAVEASNFNLNFNSLQIQAPFGSTNNASFVFGDAWHCVGFVTPGILSGLFVVIMLLAITGVGICWLMDINTMDRFDDPKGKTITINASE